MLDFNNYCINTDLILLNIHILLIFFINMIKFTAIFYKSLHQITLKIMSSTLKLSQRETAFNQEVVTRFELYNSLFQTLPFYQVKEPVYCCLFSARIAKRDAIQFIANRNYRIVL